MIYYFWGMTAFILVITVLAGVGSILEYFHWYDLFLVPFFVAQVGLPVWVVLSFPYLIAAGSPPRLTFALAITLSISAISWWWHWISGGAVLNIRDVFYGRLP